MELKRLGTSIKKLRTAKGLTQEELGQKIGVTWEMVSRYERGLSSPLSRLDIIAKILGSDPSTIFASAYDIRLADNSNENQLRYIAEIDKSKLESIDSFEDFLKLSPQASHYTAPNWVIELDNRTFVIESSLVDEIPEEKLKTPLLYIAPSIKPTVNDFLLIKYTDALRLTLCTKPETELVEGEVFLGVLIATETRYR